MTKFAWLPELMWSALVALTIGAITIWSAYLFGLHITGPGFDLVLGLGLNGLAVLVSGLTLTVGIVTAPAAIRRRWAAREPLAASLIGMAWITACALSTALVIRTNPLALPGWPTDSGAAGWTYVIVAISVFSLFMIMSIVPAALGTLRGGGRSEYRSPYPSPTTRGSERLWILLESLFKLAPGPVDEKTVVRADGTIVTSQGALADMLDTSKGSISRWLLELQEARRINVETASHETRIRKESSAV